MEGEYHILTVCPAYHTETALLRLTYGILQVIDKHEDTTLVLLDLSAAFDDIDHQVLLNRSHQKFAFRDLALKWLASYLADRKQSVHIRSAVSVDSKLRFAVPQGSVLGPVVFPCTLLTWRILSFLTVSILCSTLTITVRFTSQWGSAIEMHPSVKLKIVQATLLFGIPTQSRPKLSTSLRSFSTLTPSLP